jgi:hypothetical protein
VATAEPGKAPRRFWLALAGIALFGLALRVAYSAAVDLPVGLGDDLWYHETANRLAGGHGFSVPFYSQVDGRLAYGYGGADAPTAFHLPLFSAVLAVFSKLGLTSYNAHQVIGCALGAGTVIVIGLVGRRLGGPRLGLVAASIAAVYLPLVVNDSILMSESLFGLLIAVTLLAAVRLWADPTGRRAFALGLAIGLSALTRSEALLLVVLFVPLLWRAGGRRVANLALVAVGALVLTVPWMVRNTATFDEPVLLTTGDGSVVAGANLPSTYYGDLLGNWDFVGLSKTPRGGKVILNEAVRSRRWRQDGFDYISDHKGRVPAVVAARIGRTFSFYPVNPAAQVRFQVEWQNHIRWVQWGSIAMYLLVLVAAVAGALRLRAQGRPLTPFVAVIVLVVFTSAVGYGAVRFRQAADVALVVLAAAGVEPFVARRMNV